MSVSTSHLFQILARICTCLMETEPGIAISTLLNVKGGLENHLLQVRKEKKKIRVVVECMFALVACTHWCSRSHSHAHTLSRSKTISSGRNVGGVYLSRRSPPDWRANLYGLHKQDFDSSTPEQNVAKHAWREHHMAHLFSFPFNAFSLLRRIPLFSWLPSFLQSSVNLLLLFCTPLGNVLDNWIVLYTLQMVIVTVGN